jgi:Gas vesicle protein
MDRTERPLSPQDELTLAELVNRVLDRGAIVAGEVVISVAGIDLIYVGLQVAIAAAETANRPRILPDR